jgi:flavin-dependent dehydrogenase
VADVVIAGYGPAGAAAAIAAHDAGRNVLILESAERGGGNARYSGGFLFRGIEVRYRCAAERLLLDRHGSATGWWPGEPECRPPAG